VELPHPGESARAQILRIHSRKMKVDLEDVNFDELARCTEDFNGAQMKAVAVESGMIALRREATVIKHEDFMEAINGTIYLFIYLFMVRIIFFGITL
jgi:26S proteasome regulatory subunit T5